MEILSKENIDNVDEGRSRNDMAAADLSPFLAMSVMLSNQR